MVEKIHERFEISFKSQCVYFSSRWATEYHPKMVIGIFHNIAPR